MVLSCTEIDSVYVLPYSSEIGFVARVVMIKFPFACLGSVVSLMSDFMICMEVILLVVPVN